LSDEQRTGRTEATPVNAPARRARLQAAIVLAAVVLTSLVGGIALDRFVLHRHRPGVRMERRGPDAARPARSEMSRRIAERMGSDLDLTPDQLAHVDTIIGRQLESVRAIMDRTRPAMDSVLAGTRVAIDSLLTPEQRVRFDSLRARRGTYPDWRQRRPDSSRRR
jgi:Spy/CpxP family protein refolding chaperone